MSYQRFDNPQNQNGPQPDGYTVPIQDFAPQRRTYTTPYTPRLPPEQRPDDYQIDPDLQRAQDIMRNDLCGCFSNLKYCLASTFCFCILFGMNFSKAQGKNCCLGCCCYPFFLGEQHSYVQRLVGVEDLGILANYTIFGLCGCCALAQQSRALEAMDVYLHKPVGINNQMYMQ